MMLTIGTPARTEQIVVKSQGLQQLTDTLNHDLVTTANQNGAALNSDTKLVTLDDTQRLAVKMITASAANQTHISLATIKESLTSRLQTAAKN